MRFAESATDIAHESWIAWLRPTREAWASGLLRFSATPIQQGKSQADIAGLFHDISGIGR